MRASSRSCACSVRPKPKQTSTAKKTRKTKERASQRPLPTFKLASLFSEFLRDFEETSERSSASSHSTPLSYTDASVLASQSNSASPEGLAEAAMGKAADVEPQHAALQAPAWLAGSRTGPFTVPAGGGPSASAHPSNAFQYEYSAAGGPEPLWAPHAGMVAAPSYQQQMVNWALYQQAQIAAVHASHSSTPSPAALSVPPSPQPPTQNSPGNLVAAFGNNNPSLPAMPPPSDKPSNLSLGKPNNQPTRSQPPSSKPLDPPSPVQDLNFDSMSKDVDAYRHRMASEIPIRLAAKPSPPATKTVPQTMPTPPLPDPRERHLSASPSTHPGLPAGLGETAEEWQASDPLATQMWKFFSRAKGSIPHSARMENLSWRMGGMKLSQVVSQSPAPVAEKDKGTPASSHSQPEEDDELERRGRKTKSTSHTPEYSGSSGPSDMDWKEQSRSRSRAPMVADMDWRGASRSRSRAGPRQALPVLHDEAPPSSALAEGLSTLEQDFYSQIFGTSNPLLPTTSVVTATAQPAEHAKSHKPDAAASSDHTAADWLTAILEKPDFDWSKPIFTKEPPPSRSYTQDPAQPQHQNGSVPGLVERSAPENQHQDFGYIPKLVRKTSADVPVSVGGGQNSRRSDPSPSAKASSTPSKKKVEFDMQRQPSQQQHGQLQPMPRNAHTGSIDLAALSRPAPSGISPPMPLGSPNVTTPGSYSHYSLKAPSSYVQSFQPASASPSPALAHQYSFTSLPNSPNTNTPGYFNFLPFSQTMGTSFVDPSVLSGPSPSTPHLSTAVNTLATLQNLGLSPLESELPWALSPDAVSDLQSRPATPHSTRDSHSNSYADLTGLGVADFTASQSFEGGPKRTTAAAKRKADAHARSTSVSGASAGLSGAAGSGADGGQLVCSNCKTLNTPLWRRDEAGKPLCNGCGLFKKLHGTDRPLSLATGIIKKRNRNKTKDKDGKKPSGTARTAARTLTPDKTP